MARRVAAYQRLPPCAVGTPSSFSFRANASSVAAAPHQAEELEFALTRDSAKARHDAAEGSWRGAERCADQLATKSTSRAAQLRLPTSGRLKLRCCLKDHTTARSEPPTRRCRDESHSKSTDSAVDR